MSITEIFNNGYITITTLNKSTLCYRCEKKGKVAISYRNKQDVHKVAFYVCEYCLNFSGFINWKTHKKMPYYKDMEGLVKMKLVNNDWISLMQRTHNHTCFKCDKDDIYKLRIRKRDENSYEFVGYICKNCRTCFFINTASFDFGTLERSSKSLGWVPVTFGEDEEKPIIKEIEIKIKKSDIAKLKKAKIQFNYA